MKLNPFSKIKNMSTYDRSRFNERLMEVPRYLIRVFKIIRWSMITLFILAGLLVVKTCNYIVTTDLNTYGVVVENSTVPDSFGKEMTVYGPVIKVFSEPYGNELSLIPVGSRVRVVAQEKDHLHFVEISAAGIRGWIPKAYLEIEEKPETK